MRKSAVLLELVCASASSMYAQALARVRIAVGLGPVSIFVDDRSMAGWGCKACFSRMFSVPVFTQQVFQSARACLLTLLPKFMDVSIRSELASPRFWLPGGFGCSPWFEVYFDITINNFEASIKIPRLSTKGFEAIDGLACLVLL
jgi:hypothetical protein